MFALGAYNVITTLFGFEKSMERIGGSGFDSSDLNNTHWKCSAWQDHSYEKKNSFTGEIVSHQ